MACLEAGHGILPCADVQRIRFALALALATLGALLLHARGADAKEEATSPDPMTLEVPGFADAFYYKPRGKSRKPILMYVHGRGGNAFEDCRKWARVARQFGWVVCPQGPAATDTGGRTWNNDADGGLCDDGSR